MNSSSKKLLKKAKPSAILKNIEPMLATLVTEPVEEGNWMYEIKWDGYRALAAKHGEDVQLLSLKNKNLAWDFPAVVTAVRTIKAKYNR